MSSGSHLCLWDSLTTPEKENQPLNGMLHPDKCKGNMWLSRSDQIEPNQTTSALVNQLGLGLTTTEITVTLMNLQSYWTSRLKKSFMLPLHRSNKLLRIKQQDTTYFSTNQEDVPEPPNKEFCNSYSDANTRYSYLSNCNCDVIKVVL